MKFNMHFNMRRNQIMCLETYNNIKQGGRKVVTLKKRLERALDQCANPCNDRKGGMYLGVGKEECMEASM